MIVRALVNGQGPIWREETSATAAKEFPTQKIRFHLFVGYNRKNNQCGWKELKMIGLEEAKAIIHGADPDLNAAQYSEIDAKPFLKKDGDISGRFPLQ